MKTILETIIEHKQMEVLKRKGRKPLDELKKKHLYNRNPVDPVSFFGSGRPNIIAEFKRRSPSKGVLSEIINPVPVISSYREGGAMASSILTDRDFFGGSFRDLENVKESVEDFPLLRKDFIIDPYQVHESKAYGADMILLIAAVLDRAKTLELANLAAGLGLGILLEVHTLEEADQWNPAIRMVGVNNRDLKDFSVDINRSVNLYPELPAEVVKISESGLQTPEDIHQLFEIGYRGFLMGERFMKSDDPGAELGRFIAKL